MTTQTEALKLALEALENPWKAGPDGVADAITAIREALAQPELCKYGQEPKSCTSSPMDCQCAIDATLAQPEQEPVALETIYETIIQWDEGGGKRSRRELARRIAALYTTPPQRTWVGLTDEEIYKAEEGAWYMDELDKIIYAKNIEAKLKEKNT